MVLGWWLLLTPPHLILKEADVALILNRSDILVEDRQRTEMDPTKLRELRTSILSKGLFHAPVVRQTADGKWRLVLGERRLRCMDEIAKDGEIFRYTGIDILPGTVPVTELTLQTMAEFMEAELEENLMREDLSWQDRDRALVAIHKMRLEANPAQTQVATAKELAELGGAAGRTSAESIRKGLSEAMVIAEHLHDPDIQKARSHSEAYSIVLRRDEEAAYAALQRRQVKQNKSSATPAIQVLHGSCYDLMPTLPDNSVDLILTDPPYGIGVDSGGFRSRTVEHHNYKDTVEVAVEAIKFILTEGWRVCKPTANVMIFSDIDHFPLFKVQASQMGWKPFRTPITWQKSLSEGQAPWGRHGFRRTTEWIFFATKGDRGLLYHPVDCIHVKRVHRSERIFGAQKPLDLMHLLIDCATLQGDTVLDPFLGSGATIAAARRGGRRGVGIEQSEATYNTALKFVFDDDKTVEEADAQPA